MQKYGIIALLIVCIVGAGFIVYKDVKAQDAQEGIPTVPGSHSGGFGGPGAPAGSSQWGGGGGAPGGPGGGGRGARMLARLTTQLNLTSAQVAALKPILDSQRTTMMGIRNDLTLKPEQRAAAMAAARADSEKKMGTVLTPEQMTKYTAMMAQMRARWGGGGGRGPGGPGGGGPGGGQWGGGGPGGGLGGPGGGGPGGGGVLSGQWSGPGG